MNRLLIAGWVVCCGCGPIAPSHLPGAARSAIVGGTVDEADSQVFELIILGDNGMTSSCTGTLIDNRTLLTAAHCVDPRTLGALSLTFKATNLSSDADAGAADFIAVLEARTHPDWNLNTLDHDLGLALLETSPPGVSPKMWNTQSVTAMSGLPLRAIGYGTTGPDDAGIGTRREVAMIFRQVTPAKIFIGDQATTGICRGDSGGPSFHTFPDGTERVVGVHSYTLDSSCLDGADTRVDAEADFIHQWIEEKEAPSCGEDGRCKSDCVPVDLDCVCAPDGICSTACPSLLKDPDCPKDCVANGVCSVKACPTPDVDCAQIGNPCTGPLQCVNRSCVSDAQHLPYCSLTCSGPSDCPAKMECDGVCRFKQLPLVQLGLSCKPDKESCGPGAVCTGRSAGFTVCERSCFDARDCDPDLSCALSFDGQKFCASKDPVVLKRISDQLPAAPVGCSAAPPGLLVGLALLGWRRRS